MYDVPNHAVETKNKRIFHFLCTQQVSKLSRKKKKTMKSTSLIVAFVVIIATTMVEAFHAPIVPVRQQTSSLAMATPDKKSKQGNLMEQLLRKISNNFQPFHGHGSLENDLEDQWQAQQEILRNRRAEHIDKAHLKKKYSDPSHVKFDGKVGDSKTSSFGKNLSP